MGDSAFVLINCSLGSEAKVMQQIHELGYVEKVYRVYGVYDIVAKINGSDKEDLQKKTLRLRRLDDIKSTLTLLEISR